MRPLEQVLIQSHWCFYKSKKKNPKHIHSWRKDHVRTLGLEGTISKTKRKLSEETNQIDTLFLDFISLQNYE
jgi:hypothetical protein